MEKTAWSDLVRFSLLQNQVHQERSSVISVPILLSFFNIKLYKYKRVGRNISKRTPNEIQSTWKRIKSFFCFRTQRFPVPRGAPLNIHPISTLASFRVPIYVFDPRHPLSTRKTLPLRMQGSWRACQNESKKNAERRLVECNGDAFDVLPKRRGGDDVGGGEVRGSISWTAPKEGSVLKVIGCGWWPCGSFH